MLSTINNEEEETYNICLLKGNCVLTDLPNLIYYYSTIKDVIMQSFDVI